MNTKIPKGTIPTSTNPQPTSSTVQNTGTPIVKILETQTIPARRTQGSGLFSGSIQGASTSLQDIAHSSTSIAQAHRRSNAPVSGSPGKQAEKIKSIIQKLPDATVLSHSAHTSLTQNLQDICQENSCSPELKNNPDLQNLLTLAVQNLLFSFLAKAAIDCRSADHVPKDIVKNCLQATDASTSEALTDATTALQTSFSSLEHFNKITGEYAKNIITIKGIVESCLQAKTTLLSEVEHTCALLPQLKAHMQQLSQCDIAALHSPLPLPSSVNITDIHDTLSALQTRCSQGAHPSPPFAEFFLQTTHERITKEKTALEVRSAEVALILCEATRILKERITSITPTSRQLLDLEELGDRMVDLLSIANKSLLKSDTDLLATELSLALQSMDLGELLAEGNLLCRQPVTSLPDYQEAVARFKEQAATRIHTPGCPEEHADTLNQFLKALNERVTELYKEQRGNLHQFFAAVDKTLLEAEMALQSNDMLNAKSLADEALRHIADTKKRTDSSLSAEAKAILAEGIANVESQANLIALLADINKRGSLRLDNSSMQRIAQEVETSTQLSAQDKQLLRDVILKHSIVLQQKLHTQLRTIVEHYTRPENMQNIRHMKADLQGLFLQAQRTLTTEHVDLFAKDLDRAQNDMQSALFQLVKNDTQRPYLNQLIQTMSPNQLRIFQHLCTRTWADPILLQRLDCISHNEGAQAIANLLAALDKAWQGAPTREKGQEAVALLEKATLLSPELDTLSLELEKSCLPSSEHALLLQKHGCERGKRELGKIFRKERGTSAPVSDTFLRLAVQGLEGKHCHGFDLQLLKVYWHTLLAAEGIGGSGSPERFARFQAELPNPYREMNPTLLSALMNSGFSGSSKIHDVVNTLGNASRSLGTNTRMREIFQQVCYYSDRYNAEKIMTIISRNLLDSHSITGEQAMEVGGALRSALHTRLEKKASATERLVDRLRSPFQKGGVLRGSFSEQVTKVVERFPEIKADVQALLERDAIFDTSERILAGSMEEHAKNLIGVTQKKAILAGDMAEALPLINPEKLKGEQFCVGVLALDDIITNTGFAYGRTWQEQQHALSHLAFQKLLSIGEMRGAGWGALTEEEGAAFKKAIIALNEAKTEAEFLASKDQVASLIDSHSLLPKAKAILFFKTQAEVGGADTIQRALTSKHNFPAEGICVQRMQNKYAMLRGSGARTAKAMSLAATATIARRKTLSDTIDTSLHATSTHVAHLLNSAVHLSVLDAFNKTSCPTFEEFLKQVNGGLENLIPSQRSAHFSDMLSTLEHKLGIPHDLSEMALAAFFKSVKPDFMQRLAADTDYGFTTNVQHVALAQLMFQRMALGEAQLTRPSPASDVHSAVKKAIEENRAHKAALHLLSKLENNQHAALNLNTGLALSASAFQSGLLDLRVTATIAKQNGMCIWRNAEGVPCITLAKGFSGGLGASINGLMDSLAAKAGIQGHKMEDITLNFPSDDALAKFTGEFFAGKSALESLRYCTNMIYSNGLELGANAVFTTDDMSNVFGIVCGIAELNFETEASCAKIWTEVKEGDLHTVKDSFKYDLSMYAQVGLLGSGFIQLILNPAVDVLGKQFSIPWAARDKAHQAISHTDARATYNLTITKESSKTFKSGVLSGAATTRFCTLGTSNQRQEANAALVSFDVEDALLEELLDHVEKLEKEGAQCSLELKWVLREDALKTYQRTTNRKGQDAILASSENFTLDSIIVKGTKTATQHKAAIGGKGQLFKYDANGMLSSHFVYKPSPGKAVRHSL